MRYVKGLTSFILSVLLLLILGCIWVIGWLEGRQDHWIILLMAGGVSVLAGQIQDLKKRKVPTPPTRYGQQCDET